MSDRSDVPNETPGLIVDIFRVIAALALPLLALFLLWATPISGGENDGLVDSVVAIILLIPAGIGAIRVRPRRGDDS